MPVESCDWLCGSTHVLPLKSDRVSNEGRALALPDKSGSLRAKLLPMTAPGLDGEIREGRHEMAVRVYYEDTDFTGIVYHANYLRFMERGRTNYLRLIGADQRSLFEAAEREAPGFAFVVRSIAIEFFKPARMDDVLVVTTEPEEVKGASMILRQKVMREADMLVEARVRVAFVSGGRARPILKPLRAAMLGDCLPGPAPRHED